MKKGYKNKRDFYKAEAERNAEAAKMWRESANEHRKRAEDLIKKQQEEKSKRYHKTVFCGNCKEVSSVSIPPQVKIESGDCVVCRVRGMLTLVHKVN